MKSRTILVAGVCLVAGALAVYSAGANAQTGQPGARIVGYSVYAHSQYVLLQQADGRLRSCKINRQTALRRSTWECENLDPLP